MAKELSRDDAQAALHDVVEGLAAQFTDRRSEDRLTQIRFHTNTAAMAIGHLFEEEERRQQERADRIARIEAGEEA